MAAAEAWRGVVEIARRRCGGTEYAIAPNTTPLWSDPLRFDNNGNVQRIVLLRHAQSTANANGEVYGQVPDWRIPLTQRGHTDSVKLGNKLRQLVGNNPVRFIVSPYIRTKQTYLGVRRGMGKDANIIGATEDPRIREQQFGNFLNQRTMNYLFGVRQLYGRVFWRFREGESGLDVHNRVADLIESEMNTSNYPPNTTLVLVTHGLALRCFLMRWLWMSVSDFEKMSNPPNCGMVVLNRTPDNQYNLTKESQRVINFPSTLRGGSIK